MLTIPGGIIWYFSLFFKVASLVPGQQQDYPRVNVITMEDTDQNDRYQNKTIQSVNILCLIFENANEIDVMIQHILITLLIQMFS